MKILILQGSPRKDGNTAAIVQAFCEGAEESGHDIQIISVANLKIAGCLSCEYCHTYGNGHCAQKDDMDKVYEALKDADMIVLASPIYYFTLSGQLQCAIHRTYSVGIPKKLKKSALFLTSGSPNVYEPAILQYKMIFLDYMNLEDMGIITAHGAENKSFAKLEEAKNFGKCL